jgi:hypothetical protein
MSPTQRSKAHAKALGYTVAIVEHWNSFARIRQDLFGFGDLLCMKPNTPLLLVQTTNSGNISSRVNKIAALPESSAWLSTGNQIEVWGWAKRGAKGKRKTWTIKKVVFPHV